MKKGLTALAAIAALGSLTTVCRAGEIDDLRKQMDDLSVKVRKLEASEKKEEPGKEGYLKKLVKGTTFGGYGELDYAFTRENGNGKGGNVFDPHRLVLYVNSELAEWVTLNAELEWEHGGIKDELNDEGELSGEVRVEQAFLDFHIAKPLNVKAGVLLVPLGATNLYHEPTNFNSTERPQLDRFLIPSTWSEMGAGIHGEIGKKADYQLLVVNGLDGSKFSAKNALRDGRQNYNEDVNRGKAITGRVELRPMSNLNTNFSFYTGNSAPTGNDSAWTTIAAFDGKYRIGDFDLMGEYVQIFQSNAAALGVDDIGSRMSGYWVEGAYHVMPQALKKGKLAESDAVVFARYSEFDTQQGNLVDPSKKSGLYNRSYTNFGVVFKPVPTVAVKADYQIYDDRRSAGQQALDNDKFQVSLGFVF